MVNKEPVDCIGNILRKGDFVAVQFTRPPVATIIHADSGGLLTPDHRVTPALLRLIIDMNIMQEPGVPFSTLIKVVGPQSQKYLEDLMSKIPKS